MPILQRRMLVPLLIFGSIACAYALHHSSKPSHSAASAPIQNPNLAFKNVTAPEKNQSPIDNQPKLEEGDALLSEMLARIIAAAIDNGSLNPATFTAEQLALFPQWLKDKIAAATSRRLADEGKHSADDETEQPEAPQKFPCPEPGKLPPDWNNEYNKIYLRQQGCQL